MTGIPPIAGASSAALAIILALLEQRTGQRIAANRNWRVETALKPLLRARALASLDALANALVDGADPALSELVVDALLNHETSFFRDAGVIEQLGDVIAAQHDRAPSRRLRLWSAGCANGQEPLSLAMLAADLPPPVAGALDIHASDVSAASIERARAGRYSRFEIQRGLPVRRMLRWFDADGDEWVARPELRARIQFRRHNLVADPPLPGQFDVILCRNVLIYLSPTLRRTVLDKLSRALRPEGVLVLGAGETVIGQTGALVPSGRWRGLYQRSEPSLERSAAAC